jgi:uncharacterized OB-fold protein
VVALTPQPGPVPVTAPGTLSEPFWAGCAAGELRYQRCGGCGWVQFPPAPNCRDCLSDALSWQASSGLGTVYSATVVWRPPSPAFQVPYAPAIVDLDEGFQVVTNLVDLDTDDLTTGGVGMRVEVVFRTVAAGRTLPYFRPVGPARLDEGATE